VPLWSVKLQMPPLLAQGSFFHCFLKVFERAAPERGQFASSIWDTPRRELCRSVPESECQRAHTVLVTAVARISALAKSVPGYSPNIRVRGKYGTPACPHRCFVQNRRHADSGSVIQASAKVDRCPRRARMAWEWIWQMRDSVNPKISAISRKRISSK